MSGRRSARVIAGIGAASGLLVLGALGGAVLTERRHAERDLSTAHTPPSAGEGMAAAPAPGHRAHAAVRDGSVPAADDQIEVTLTSEAMQRAGIKVVAATATERGGSLTVPGTVMSNAYRDTKVNALVGGVVRQVHAELGATVRRGEPLAVIFSSELADAQMKYISARALLHAEDQTFERARKLVDIGAVSRQELDDTRAVREARATELEAARQRLIFLGLTTEQAGRLSDASQIVSDVVVTAPADGVVIARSVNPGQVIANGQELFAVTDLTTVWAIGDLYEKDIRGVRVGTPATITVPSGAARPIAGHVAYVDPRVDPATRTAKIRVEVPNRGGELKLGMFVEVMFTTGSGGQRTVVPRAALQSVSGRAVVYVAAMEEGRFIERTIRPGAVVGDAIEVLEGLKPGERIVADGSFYLRSEAGRTRGGG